MNNDLTTMYKEKLRENAKKEKRKKSQLKKKKIWDYTKPQVAKAILGG